MPIPARYKIITKTILWQLISFIVVWALTRDLSVGILYITIKTFLYYFYEKIWKKIKHKVFA